MQNIRILKFRTKNALFGCFGEQLWKSKSNQFSLICLIAKFGPETKVLKFWTKNALFGYFWDRILKKLFPYLKSAPSNLPNCKTLRKNKNA